MNSRQVIALIIGGALIYGVWQIKWGTIPPLTVLTRERPNGFESIVVEDRGDMARILLGVLLAVALAVTLWLLRTRPGGRVAE